MDQRLIEAARTGNVELLLNLIEDDPLTLHAAALLAWEENPLHIAAKAGHLTFVQQILQLRPEFSQELDRDGFSPLHIASANGCLEIVQELLRVDLDLCLMRGREKRIPLHYAAVKGRIRVVKELLAAIPRCVEEVTARGETALHLAVKNNQFEAFELLVQHLKAFEKEVVLNCKDKQGNSILHIAASKKQYEVVDLLLGDESATNGAVEVNSLNKNGLTALDVLLSFESEATEREIEDILRQAGANRARDLQTLVRENSISQNQNSGISSSSEPSFPSPAKHHSPADQLLEYFKYNKARDSPSEARNTLLVIAILITTATYQAALSPPGGVWQDDSSSHTAGKSVMCSKNSILYGLFLFSNSVGFFTSLSMICILTSGFPLQLELRVAMFALLVTYDVSLDAMTPKGALTLLAIFLTLAIPTLISILTIVARNYLMRPREALHRRSLQSA